MQKQQVIGLFALLAATAAVIGAAQFWTAEQAETAPLGQEVTYEEIPANTPTAQVEGETISPNGRFEVRAEGRSDLYVSGVVTPEKLQVVDRETGEVKWEDQGWVTQSALWSPDSDYFALAYGGRTWQAVRVIETDTWTSWDFALPDGSAIPEYTFLPEDWGAWEDTIMDENSFRVTVGYGDGAEPAVYRCFFHMEDGALTGDSYEESVEVLPGDYDFDHDGEADMVELAATYDHAEGEKKAVGQYVLTVRKADGTTLWSTSAHWAHSGWTSMFACKVDGQDFLLQYEPEMWQGWADYSFKLFYPYIVSPVTREREEQVLRESYLAFDGNFRMEGHHFDASELADFLWEVRGYIMDSTLLLSTEDGEFLSDVPGLEMQAYPFGELLALDSREAVEAALCQWESEMKTEQGAA